MNTTTPTTIEQYLEQVRRALAGADAAMIQDALYDAEEYLRSELAENPKLSEAEVVARVAGSYGAPEEVAAIYRDTETKVAEALRAPPAPPRRSLLGRFFGVAADARTWGALFYMLLSLATGIAYFTIAVTGVSLSAGFAILIIGVPFVIVFLGLVRVLSLVEGRIVEVMLGERMPRRPLYADRGKPLMERIKDMFTDPRTWSTLLYMLLMLPLGILYFTVVVTGTAVGLSFTLAPVGVFFASFDERNYRWLRHIDFDIGSLVLPPAIGVPLMFVLGILITFGLMHLARGVGRVHGAIAKQLLVRSAQF